MEKKTFTAEEDLEEAIRMARYESFLVGPEMAAGKRVTKLREKQRAADRYGAPLTRAEEVSLRFLGLLYPPAKRSIDERPLAEHPFWDLPAEADLEAKTKRVAAAAQVPDPLALEEDEPNELDGDGGEAPTDEVDFVAWLKGQSRYPARILRDVAMRRFHRRYVALVPDLIIDLMRNYDDLVDNAQGPSIMPDEELCDQFKVVLKRRDNSLKNAA